MVKLSTLGLLVIAASLVPIFRPSPFVFYLWLVLVTVILGIALMVIGGEIEAIRGEIDDLSDEVMALRKRLREVSE